MKSAISVSSRLSSMILEQFTMIPLIAVLSIPATAIFRFIHPVRVGEKFVSMDASPVFFYYSLVVVSLYFNKDCLQGRSIAKRILKLQVVNFGTVKPANPIRCLIRNITLFIWPLEAIVAMINPGRRLGDFIAGTELIQSDPAVSDSPMHPWQILFSVSFTTIFLKLVSLFFSDFFG
ncbi:MAG TPA: RDD family protein [Chryseolinea sp.]